MTTSLQYPHLTRHADGSVRIGLTRYKVLYVAGEHYFQGWSAEEILRNHPDLRPEEVYAALTYYYDHRDEMIAELKAAKTLAAEHAASNPPAVSRAEMERRRSLKGS